MSFPRFEVVVGNPSDHFYYEQSKPVGAMDASTDRDKKILREFKFLEIHLPDTIFVRSYETRIHLLRAAIIGAPKTPYQDFLFFFDIFLPEGYPRREPRVRFTTTCSYTINHCFQFCSDHINLGLQNAWPGQQSWPMELLDEWERDRSPVFQTLLSIQALILGENSYYGLRFIGRKGDKYRLYRAERAADYNKGLTQNCYLSTLKLLRNPPTCFEQLVKTHFQEHAITILRRYDAHERPDFDKVYSELLKQLHLIGAPVEHLVEEEINKVRAMEEEAKRKYNQNKGKWSNMFKSILRSISSGLRRGQTRSQEDIQDQDVQIHSPLLPRGQGN